MGNDNDNLEIAELYLDEWKHRDNMLVKYIFSFFISILIVSLIPYVKFKENTLVDVVEPCLFNVLGIILSFLAMFVTMRMGNRLSEVGDKYRSYIGDYDNERSTDINFSTVLPIILYTLLITMNLYLLLQRVGIDIIIF